MGVSPQLKPGRRRARTLAGTEGDARRLWRASLSELRLEAQAKRLVIDLLLPGLVVSAGLAVAVVLSVVLCANGDGLVVLVAGALGVEVTCGADVLVVLVAAAPAEALTFGEGGAGRARGAGGGCG